MITRSRITVLALAVTFAVPLVSLSPSAAQAGTSGATATIAPACVNRTVYGTPTGFDVYLQNKCGGTMSVKVIVKQGGDSPCYVMSKGTSKIFAYEGIFGKYDKTVLC
ncbi:beta-Ig-H3/fasciclin [Microbispora sp. H13382]|uniref:beta-Ig-H3/fasciclin n=1 Tax=Microbispora sp. H13382 TaxID=2729112 RepID=UPI00160379E5|nr:beta-Ig-H3/fasciclin [Microbispora sp. H13382]